MRRWDHHKHHFAFYHMININPVTPESDQHLISPYNIIPESHIEVMRMKEMITN